MHRWLLGHSFFLGKSAKAGLVLDLTGLIIMLKICFIRDSITPNSVTTSYNSEITLATSQYFNVAVHFGKSEMAENCISIYYSNHYCNSYSFCRFSSKFHPTSTHKSKWYKIELQIHEKIIKMCKIYCGFPVTVLLLQGSNDLLITQVRWFIIMIKTD